jgi:2-methylisocitrate lyase-like PEP mutase family enzyme
MAIDQAEKARRFQALHQRPGAFIIPNPWDPGSARLLDQLGFEALATTSAGFAFSIGRPDGPGPTTRDEMLAHARGIIAASALPVSADLENCFGNAPDIVAETIRQAGAAGLVGASVEDTTGDARQPIHEFGLAVERVAAAVAAARALPFPFTLTARAENFLHGRSDLDDTIKRLKAFEKAGADVLYAPGLPSLDAIRAVCAAVTKPVNVIAGMRLFTVAELADAGVKRISVGSLLARAAYGEFLRAAREMRELGTFSFAQDAVPFAEINAMMAKK